MVRYFKDVKAAERTVQRCSAKRPETKFRVQLSMLGHAWLVEYFDGLCWVPLSK